MLNWNLIEGNLQRPTEIFYLGFNTYYYIIIPKRSIPVKIYYLRSVRKKYFKVFNMLKQNFKHTWAKLCKSNCF